MVMFDNETELGSNQAMRVMSHSSSAAQIRTSKDIYLEPCKGSLYAVGGQTGFARRRMRMNSGEDDDGSFST